MPNIPLIEVEVPIKIGGTPTPTKYEVMVQPDDLLPFATKNEVLDLAIVRSASGAIASYDDGGDLPMKSLKVNIVPKQSGTGDPSPSNVRPISGTDEVEIVRTGANVWGGSQMLNDIVKAIPDIDHSETGVAMTANKVNGKTLIEGIFKPNTRYTAIVASSDYVSNMCFVYTDNTSTQIQNTTTSGGNQTFAVTSAEGKTVKSINGVWQSGSPIIRINESGIFEGVKTVSDFISSQAEVKSITLPQTVYGGTLDVVSGKLIIDRGFKQYDGINTQSGTSVTGGWRCDFSCPDDDINKGKWTAADGIPLFSMFANKALADGGFSKGYSANGYTVIVPNATSKAEADSILEGLQLCYWLATPIEIDLTPTEVKSLLGDNNVWSEGGTVEVEYRADTSIVINKILEALA